MYVDRTRAEGLTCSPRAKSSTWGIRKESASRAGRRKTSQTKTTEIHANMSFLGGVSALESDKRMSSAGVENNKNCSGCPLQRRVKRVLALRGVRLKEMSS